MANSAPRTMPNGSTIHHGRNHIRASVSTAAVPTTAPIMYGSSLLSCLRCIWKACQSWPRRSLPATLFSALAAFFSSFVEFLEDEPDPAPFLAMCASLVPSDPAVPGRTTRMRRPRRSAGTHPNGVERARRAAAPAPAPCVPAHPAGTGAAGRRTGPAARTSPRRSRSAWPRRRAPRTPAA